MKKINRTLFCLSCITLLVLLITGPSLFADENEVLSGKQYAQLARGGVLYDDWPIELGIKIDKTHPSYPANGKKTGATTWRCKECHGWDYMGKEGAYSKGSHYTGIPGIRPSVYKNLETTIKILKNDTHAFGNIIPEDALEALALFVSYGQVAVDIYIDRSTRKVKGYIAGGGRIYLNTCVKCHGEDGKAIDFGSEKEPEYLGTLANENPWEALHKIRWGQPGTQMVSLLFLGLRDQLDVLSFCQTLPSK